ncbi:MAG: ribose 5-phosphate isomerase A [Eubacterium sp.]|nr:ribose 5-phosphate isomerase A [Eubacterium sp.]
MKQKCAQKALEMIEDGMTIGLGGGSTVALLIGEIEKNKKKIQAVTPSQDTLRLCMEHHIPVLPLEMTDTLDLAFDGCDELDMQLNALKSCGGIHTREKLVAAMAKEYVLLADEGKCRERLSFAYPVTVEVLRASVSYVKKCLVQMGAQVTERRSDGKAGILVSEDGNYLLEAKFHDIDDVEALCAALDRIPGMVGHSLFYQAASKAVIAKADGGEIKGEIKIKILEKPENSN